MLAKGLREVGVGGGPAPVLVAVLRRSSGSSRSGNHES